MEAFINSLKPYTKAIVAFIIGVLQVTALYVALNADGELSPDDINAIINATIIALGGTGLVYTLPNTKAK